MVSARIPALLCAPAAIATPLAAALKDGGYRIHAADPAELRTAEGWQAAIGATTHGAAPLRLLVHAVPMPLARIGDVDPSRFEATFEEVVGSLWLGCMLCADAMAEGGAIVVLSPRGTQVAPSAGSVTAMFADGVTALANCFGVAFAGRVPPVRVVNLLLDGDWREAVPPSPQITTTLLWLASDEASYLTATSVGV